MNVTAGTLGGKGTIAGAVAIGTGAILAPAHGKKLQATLKIQGALTFSSDSIYNCTFKAKSTKARTDSVVANGVTIEDGATFNFNGQAQRVLRSGLVFTVTSNTSAQQRDLRQPARWRDPERQWQQSQG